MKKQLIFALTLIATPLVAAEQPGADAVKDTSYVDANGHRVQQLTADIDAPVLDVWNAFATDEGFVSWAAPVAHVTLANDGMIEASYSLSAKIGDPDNIRNRIVAYVPERVMVLANDHAPKNAPFDAAAFQSIRTVIEFQAVDKTHTRVTESGVGYGDGAAYDGVYKHFVRGNTYEFALLVQRFRTGPVDWKKALANAQQ